MSPSYKDKLSDTAKRIIDNRAGYRYPSCYGSGISDLKSIINFEINILENYDINETCKTLYNKINTTDITTFIQEKLDSDLDTLKGIWLTSKNGAKKYYNGNNKNEEPLKIDLTNINYIIISDLSEEGILIAYKGDEIKCVQE